jgi:hypothetical protein
MNEYKQATKPAAARRKRNFALAAAESRLLKMLWKVVMKSEDMKEACDDYQVAINICPENRIAYRMCHL